MTNREILSSEKIFNRGEINKNVSFLKKLMETILFILVLIFILKQLINLAENDRYENNLLVANFKTDMNKLWDTSLLIESYKTNKFKYKKLNRFGANGKIVNLATILPDLKYALLKIADKNKNMKLSNAEIKNIGLMGLASEIYLNELKTLQYNDLTVDNNLQHYIIITKGKYAGTILYNGLLKIIDLNNNQYFGVEFSEKM